MINFVFLTFDKKKISFCSVMKQFLHVNMTLKELLSILAMKILLQAT